MRVEKWFYFGDMFVDVKVVEFVGVMVIGLFIGIFFKEEFVVSLKLDDLIIFDDLSDIAVVVRAFGFEE